MRHLVYIVLLGLTNVASIALAETYTVSDETAPATCPNYSYVASFACSGEYCDNITFTCQEVSGLHEPVYSWSDWFSEEDSLKTCPANTYIAGLACNGDYCDNLSIFCRALDNNYRTISFSASSVFSEETSEVILLDSRTRGDTVVLANGISCSGTYCDNKSVSMVEVEQ